ncbi:hypothetical protein H310_00966 [Aphanomyces invadans]|uniref:EXS domain-containing protein n=2 Tax=Aphanomyces invadans TaxID=157072 RepID=A0A024UPL1_9STRA|nr:hypothetical protein H310_00966 [Aphanomyces invadans]ETW08371.1 hypothetical protein H310_00966 [Aphanomyces invadans]|eukprot:XP_008862176.1 hypothetical protein H310_00966 [Aphanomyces invadans]
MPTHDDEQELKLLADWEQEDDIRELRNAVRRVCEFFTDQLRDQSTLLSQYERMFDAHHDAWDLLTLRRAKLSWLELHRRLLWLKNEHVEATADLQRKLQLLRASPTSSTIDDEKSTTTLPSADAIIRLLDILELRMLHRFYNGNTRTMKHDLYPQSEDIAVWSGLYFGMHVGMMVVLFIWVVWDSVIDDSKNHNLWESSVMAVYRAIGVLILLLWCWCVQVYVFNWYSIPFLAIFEWKATKSVQFVSLVRHAVSITIAYLVNLLVYYKAVRGDIPRLVPPYIIPFLLYVVLLVKLVYPLKQRRSLLMTMWRVVAAPWSIVRFREAYVGDVFTSLVRVFVDLAWSSCYYFSGAFVEMNPTGHDICSQSTTFHWIVVPLLSALPLWWRFCQNIRKYRDTHSRFPYIPNAMKYACAQSVVLFAVFHPRLKHPDDHMTMYQWWYLAACCITTMYQYGWDIYMDWGLGGARGLRPRRLYPTWTYYVAMAVDLFLRFGWTLTLIPPQGYGPFPSNVQIYLDPILASAEVCRRSMWGLIRVEYEHTVRFSSRNKDIDEARPSPDEDSDEDDDNRDEKYSFWVLVEILLVVALVLVVAAVAILTRSPAVQAT